MTDEALTREQLELRERIFSEVLSAILAVPENPRNRECVQLAEDATADILALLPSAQGKDGGERNAYAAVRSIAISAGHDLFRRAVNINRLDEIYDSAVSESAGGGKVVMAVRDFCDRRIAELDASPSKTERTPGTFEKCVKCHLSVQDYNLKGGCGINATTCPIAAGKE